MPTQSEQAEFATLRAEVQKGNPRPFVERYFMIRNLRNRSVPMTFLPEQVSLYNDTFGTLESYDSPAFWLVPKPREAYSTTLFHACFSACHLNIQGFIYDAVIDSDKNLGKSLIPLHNHWMENLPLWMQPIRGLWDRTYREIIHKTIDAKGLVVGSNTSILTFSTAKSTNYGRGGRPKAILLSERAGYDPLFDSELDLSLADSLTDYSWRVDESTPKGGTVFHRTVKGALAGDIPNARPVIRYWFMKENAHYPANSVLVHKEDRGALVLTDEERRVATRFPKDGILVEDRIRWRRARIRRFIPASYGDRERATAVFQQEHPEDPLTMWYNIEAAVLPRAEIQRLASSTLPPLEEGYLIPGAYYRVWERRESAHAYLAGLDPARGGRAKIGDPLAMEVIDLRTGLHVAEVYGKANVTRFTEACCAFLQARYPRCLLAIERNGVGAASIEAARRLPYSPLYYKPLRDPRSKEEPEPGWDTTSNKASMHEYLWSGLNAGTLVTRSSEMLQDLLDYNPNEKDHTPDRVMALMIAQAVRQEGHLSLLPMTTGEPMELVQVSSY